MSRGRVSLRTWFVCQSDGPRRLDITRYRVSGLTMSAVKIGDSKIAANAAIQTTRWPVPEKAGCIGGGRNFMPALQTPVTQRSRLHLSLNNISRILMPLKGQQFVHRKFSCVVPMLLIITAITRRRQGQRRGQHRSPPTNASQREQQQILGSTNEWTFSNDAGFAER